MKFKFLLLCLLSLNYCLSQSFPERKRNKKPKFFAIGGGGASFRTAKIPDGLSPSEEDYMKDLKSGMNYDISFYYQKSYISGFGLKYNAYRSKGNGYSGDIGNFGDAIKISFYGASFFITEDTNARVGEAFFEIALGYIHYRNESYAFSNQNLTFEGGNLGLSTSIAYHFRINKHILVGPQFGFTGGVLNKVKITYPDGSQETVKLDDDAKESLYRIDLNVSAKIRF